MVAGAGPPPRTVPEALTLIPSDPVVAPDTTPETPEEAPVVPTCSVILNESLLDSGATTARSPSRCTLTGIDAETAVVGAGPMQTDVEVQTPS
jgi:hypothetical protein